MPKLSQKTIKARIKVAEIAGGWILDQTGEASSETLVGEDGEYDEDLVKEAERLSQRLYKQASAFKKQLK